jgi:hypothetical protein
VDKDGHVFMVSSSLRELSEQLSTNTHIDYPYVEAKEQSDQRCFDYLLNQIVSSSRLGMRVLHEECIVELLHGALP